MRAQKLFMGKSPERISQYGSPAMAAVSDTHHILPECDLRTGCEACCQRNVHKPRLIPLPAAAVVQIHMLWCALSKH
jgi:hypothetical protein